jgi:triacylglycerol esterase/lipase EstA (alpha/beta hydrolase family)
LVNWDEDIKAHLFWIWLEQEGFLKRGKEGMLVITDRRLAFISKTEMTYRMHDTHSTRQFNRFKAKENVFRPAEGYKLEHLEKDLDKSPDNIVIPYSQILDITSEEKRWGTLLKVKVNLGDTSKLYKFSVVKGWVKYPAKDPLEFQRMDWNPLINLVKTAPT